LIKLFGLFLFGAVGNKSVNYIVSQQIFVAQSASIAGKLTQVGLFVAGHNSLKQF